MHFVDGLGELFNDGSFKMRHTKGRQQHKFCRLLFDRIDKIMYRTNSGYTFTDVSDLSSTITGFKRHEIIDDLDADARNKLEKTCREQEWGILPVTISDDLSYVRNIYPNESAPSDHPPYMISVSYSPK